jgi:hypothetical protein
MSFRQLDPREQSAVRQRIDNLRRELTNAERAKSRDITQLQQRLIQKEQQHNEKISRITREIMRLQGTSGFGF